MRDAQVRHFPILVKALAALAVVACAVVVHAARLVFAPPAPCEGPSDYALVPSGDPGHRTRHAVALYRAGRAATVVISGAGYGGDSAEVLAALARSLEPELPIVVETEARSTADNVTHTCARLPENARVAIVSDPAHVARVYLTARKLCPNWDACTAPTPTPSPLFVRLREALRLVGYQVTGRASWGIRP